MNPESPQTPRELLETRVTALLLGELSAEDADALRQIIVRDPELAALEQSLRQTIELIRETAFNPAETALPQPSPLKLSEARRQKLLAGFKTVAPKEFVKKGSGGRPVRQNLAAIAAVLVLCGVLAGLLLPSTRNLKSKAQRTSLFAAQYMRESIKEQEAAPATPTPVTKLPAATPSTADASSSRGISVDAVGYNPVPLAAAPPARQKIVLPSVKSQAEIDSFGILPVNGNARPVELALLSDGGAKSSAANSFGESRDRAAEVPRGGQANSPDYFWFGDSAGGGQRDGATFGSGSSGVPQPNGGGGGFGGERSRSGGTGMGGGGVPSRTLNPTMLSANSLGTLSAGGGVVDGGGVVSAGKPTELAGVVTDAGRQNSAQAGDSSGLAHRWAFNADANTKDNNDYLAFNGAVNEGRIGLSAYSANPNLRLDEAEAELNRALKDNPGNVAAAQNLRQVKELQVANAARRNELTGTEALKHIESAWDVQDKIEAQSLPQITLKGVSSPNTTSAIPSGKELASSAANPAGYFPGTAHPATGVIPAANTLLPPADGKDAALAVRNFARRTEATAQGEVAKADAADTVTFANAGKISVPLQATNRFSGSSAETLSSDLWAKNEPAAAAQTGALDQRRLVMNFRDVPAEALADYERMKSAAAATDKTAQPGDVPMLGMALRSDYVVQADELSRKRVAGEQALGRVEQNVNARSSSTRGTSANEAEVMFDAVAATETAAPRTPATAAAKTEFGGTRDYPNVTLPGPVQATYDPNSRQLMVSADEKTLGSVDEFIKDLDSTNSNAMRVRVFNLNNADPQDVQQILQDMFPSSGITRQSNPLQQRGTPILQNQLQGGVPVLNKQLAEAKKDTLEVLLQTNSAGRIDIDVTRGPAFADANPVPTTTHRLFTNVAPAEVQTVLNDYFARIGSNGVPPNVRFYSLNSANPQVQNDLAAGKPTQTAGTLTLNINGSNAPLGALYQATNNASLGRVVAATPEADIPAAKPVPPPPVPQPEVMARENAFSTFSLNVADVSFKLASASLEKGAMPEAASIRTEEFINAFDYRDPEPPPGAPVGFAWERARYPFAHNRDLLRFSLKTAAAGRQPGRPLNVVLVLDNSGSMERADRVRIIHEALRVLATQLRPEDKLSVVTFSRTPRLWVDGISGSKAGEVLELVAGITPEGGTDLESAINLGYATALRHYLPTGVNRVVLLTDGAANLGNVEPTALKQVVERNRKQGLALDCFGIGWEGFNDDLLEQLSRNGDGRYGFINTPEEAATTFVAQLAGALRVAASDVKVQVEFNPNRVKSWRQIGYAKHQLTKEQFRDNTVDAAEIGAAESGNALYTVETDPAGEGPIATVRVRYKVPGTGIYREQEWAVPFNGGAPSLDQAAAGLRLAATAAAFSEWLASSPFAAEVTPDQLLGTLSGVPDTYGADVRPRQLEWMIRQAKSISGK